jgi:peptidoglycan/LPS O-acetylase OafA/YrhL
MGPLLIWTAIYVGFFYVMYRFAGHGAWRQYAFASHSWIENAVGLLLGGAAIHLWFLPFILLACVIAFPLLQLAHIKPASRYLIIPLLLLIGFAGTFLPRPSADAALGIRVFLEYSTYTITTLCGAIALAMVYPKHLRSELAIWIVVCGIGLFAVCSYASWQGISSPLIRAGKGVAAGVVSLAPWSPLFVQWLAKLGTLSFGVYLLHLLMVQVTREATARWYGPVGLGGVLVQTAVAFVASYACVYACSRGRLGKLLFP